jgi:cholinesterase
MWSCCKFFKLVSQIFIFYFMVLNLIDGLVVNTGNGPVRGIQIPFGSKTINQWLGIPFAQPPVGQLRFKRPVPVNSWTTTRNATSLPNKCVQSIDPNEQPTTPLSEDCLYLSIYAPNPLPTNAPVMAWYYEFIPSFCFILNFLIKFP